MTGAVLLALTLAQAAQAPRQTALIEIGVVSTFVDGATRTISSVPGNRLVYVSSAGLCNDPDASSKEPAKDALGWKVEVEPIPGDVRIVWRRLEGAAATRGAKNGIRTLPTATNAEWIAVDHFDIPAAAGCKVLHWSLVARRASTGPSAPKLMEAELWFVHRAPDGKETIQQQIVRLRAGSGGDFYFDDTTVNETLPNRTEPVTIEVFGRLSTGWLMGDGDINITLRLTRRYINPKAIAVGLSPTVVGKTDYPTTVKLGEVISFVLPPLENDRGQFLGHRFSVRIRLKPLGPGEN